MIRQIKYNNGGNTKNLYFDAENISDYVDAKFYEHWNDCKDKNEKYIRGFEDMKVREAMATFVKNINK